MVELSKLYPVPKPDENQIVVPTILEGKLLRACLPTYRKLVGDNPHFRNKSDVPFDGIGSNLLIVGALNYVIRDSRFRVATSSDNIYPTIFPLVQNKFYTDLNALDVREKKPSYEKNNGIWEQAKNLVEENLGTLKLPARVQGFYFVLDENEENYGARIIPAENLRVIHDKRLNLPSGTRFGSLDELGMIIPKEKGKYTWYSRDDGVSRVCLLMDGGLNLCSDSLADSVDNGRMVIVAKEK